MRKLTCWYVLTVFVSAWGCAESTETKATSASDGGSALSPPSRADGAADKPGPDSPPDLGDVNGAPPAPDGADDDDANTQSDPSSTASTPLIELTGDCAGSRVRDGIPTDLAAPGPWPVGAVTTELGGLRVEVWYPAKQGSELGKPAKRYDVREQLPEVDRPRIPEAENPVQTCSCFDGLPLDDEAGPYPLVLFVHGTAGFRTTNLENVSHWASRGFVVVAADHPGIRLADMLESLGPGSRGTQAQDVGALLAALSPPRGELEFLAGHMDMERRGAVGHSAGASAISELSDAFDVVVAYAGGSAISADQRANSVLFLEGEDDSVAGPLARAYRGSSVTPRRLVSIARGGHLVGGSLCLLRDPSDPSQDIVDLAEKHGLGQENRLLSTIGIRNAFGFLFDGCNESAPDSAESFIAASQGIRIANVASTGALEEELQCSTTAGAQLAELPTTYREWIANYEEAR